MKKLLAGSVAALLGATGMTLTAEEYTPWRSEGSIELARQCIVTLLEWELLDCDYIEATDYRVRVVRNPLNSVTSVTLDNPGRRAPDHGGYATCAYDRERSLIFHIGDFRSWPQRTLMFYPHPAGWPLTAVSSDYEELERMVELTETETLSKQQVGPISRCGG